ncbi:SIMPL domain-containing protein [Seonamhaeicola sp. ML3]|uniref:SIMPL domain-containing protein n=1 Tax=Seonamhaeicola sp. ML3 TaxID=2937786 RepID=UPI00200D5CD9|nr:SIMPL domain-containing protein [Seonamhaeicola sp. ML3]
MKIINYLLLFIISTQVISAQSGSKNFIDQPYIELTGKAETEVTPNEIYLKIQINENDKKGKVSVEKQEAQLIKVLKSLNIDIDKNFSILDFDGYFQRKFLANNEVSKIKNYQLIVNDGKTLGKVYVALDKIDVSNISITKTSHTDMEQIRRDTKLKALKAAKEKADQYANAINQSIGNAIHIQEINNTFRNNSMESNTLNAFFKHEDKSYEIENLNIKSITVTASVMAKFILN